MTDNIKTTDMEINAFASVTELDYLAKAMEEMAKDKLEQKPVEVVEPVVI